MTWDQFSTGAFSGVKRMDEGVIRRLGWGRGAVAWRGELGSRRAPFVVGFSATHTARPGSRHSTAAHPWPLHSLPGVGSRE